jgi:hypothetical protein
MIDSGATSNFMSAKLTTEKGFRTQKKERPYPLFVVDGEPISSNGGMVTHETVPMTMTTLQGHKEEIKFDIVHVMNEGCILRMP